MPHEVGHFIRHKWLEGRDLDRVERALGIIDGKWTIAAEERFARIHEEYLRTGRSPNRELAPVFAKFKVWFDKVYRSHRFEANRDEQSSIGVGWARILGDFESRARLHRVKRNAGRSHRSVRFFWMVVPVVSD